MRLSIIATLATLTLGGSAHAQRVGFEGLKWGSSPSEVTDKLGMAGYTFIKTQNDDLAFVTDDSSTHTTVFARMKDRRLVSVGVIIEASVANFPKEHTKALNDLREQYGKPTSYLDGLASKETTWVRKTGVVTVRYEPYKSLLMTFDAPGYKSDWFKLVRK